MLSLGLSETKPVTVCFKAQGSARDERLPKVTPATEGALKAGYQLPKHCGLELDLHLLGGADRSSSRSGATVQVCVGVV